MEKTISIQALKRMPTYLNFLKALPPENVMNISAKAIATGLHLGEIQVRKDLAAVSGSGKPKVGYITIDLIRDIEHFLGYDDINDAILVGAGKLGKALLSYSGFREYGLNIVSAFDANESVQGTDDSGKQILPLDKMASLIKRMNVRIAIITVPSNQAQKVCDTLVAAGITAIWNFAPIHITAPDNILIKNEDMAASLAILSKHLEQQMNDN